MTKKLDEKQLAMIDDWVAAAQKSYRSRDYLQTIELCKKILNLQANNPAAHNLFGVIAYRSNHLPQAIRHFTEAINAQPDNHSHYVGLGQVYAAQRDDDKAIDVYRQAQRLNPQDHKIYNNVGFLLKRAGRFQEAIEAFNASLRINQNYALAHNNLGMVLQEKGLIEEAVKHFRIASRLNPTPFVKAQGNLLFLQAAFCLCPSGELLRQHREWGERQRAGKDIGRWPRVADPDPSRRLRIGYVSADFRQHPVATFMEPLFRNHDSNAVEIFCYAGAFQPDAISHQLESLSDHWCTTTELSDSALERRIRQDKIDILIDLGGHTANNRLAIFTRRLAPIQATYLGYCASTGLEAMDYWITDTVLHPRDTQECASEQIYRLPRCWVCYQPPEGAPDVSQREANLNQITFGSLNNVHKMSDDVYQAWAEILHSLPGSRLVLKSSRLEVQGVSDELLSKFRSLGIDTSRIELQTRTPPPDYLTVYDKIDIALDTFPRTGGTTAADALWMGVPVITLAGERYVERLVASKLEAIGRPEWVATNPQEYIAKAIELAQNPALLKELRVTQRQQIEQSPLCDAKGLAQTMEQAYREMWLNFLRHKE